MIGRFECALELTGTTPGGLVQATVPVSSGTIAMDRSWAPAVQARFTVPYTAFNLASWQLIEPTLDAQFCRLEVQDTVNGRIASWALNLRSYRHDVKAGTVELVAYSYEALVQDYGRSEFSADFTNTAVFPTSLSIIQDMCQAGAGADAAPLTGWTAPVAGGPGSGNELRFAIPGTDRWSHIAALAAHTPGGIVQHYGYGNNAGTFLGWVLTNPAFELAPGFAYLMPPEPDPDLGVNEGSATLTEWQAERSREAAGWGDASYLEYPGKSTSGTFVFTSSGYVMEYEYNDRGIAGSTTARRRQVQDSVGTRSTPSGTARNAAAADRVTRAAPRAVGQTFTQPLDVRLLPWQVHPDENSVDYMIGTITHNLGDGTTVVSANRL